MDRAGSLFTEESEGMFGFEPHAAKIVYEEMLKQANVPVVLGERLLLNREGVVKTSGRITAIRTESNNTYHGKVFLDASYEGDLMAMAGVSYHVGREANSRYDETLNGVQKIRTHNHIFPGFVDPYIEPGNHLSVISR